MGRQRFSPEQIIVKLREAEIIESKGLTQVEAASFNIALSRLKSRPPIALTEHSPSPTP